MVHERFVVPVNTSAKIILLLDRRNARNLLVAVKDFTVVLHADVVIPVTII